MKRMRAFFVITALMIAVLIISAFALAHHRGRAAQPAGASTQQKAGK